MAKSWTFGRKLGGGFAVVVLLTLVMAVVGLYSLRAVVEAKDRVIQEVGADLIDAERLRSAMHAEVAGVRGYLLTGQQRYLDDMREADGAFSASMARIRERADSEETKRLLAAIEEAEAAHQKEIDPIVSQRTAGRDTAVLLSAVDRMVIPKFDALTESVAKFVEHGERARDEGRKKARDAAAMATSILIVVAIVTVLLAILIAVRLSGALIRQIGTTVQHIRSSSVELQAAASQQASGAQEQAAAMSEITTTIGELLATSRQIEGSAKLVAEMASDSARSAQVGEDAVDRAQRSVESIKAQIDEIVRHMLELGEKSQQIGGILEIINELSEQTNILAINATIEAAGAGEAGRRFAVVGEEIRKLADRTGASTKEIRKLVTEIRSAVNTTVMATEAGSKTVDAGAARFEELQQAFGRIGDLVVSTTEAGKEIELSTKQQSTAVEQVNIAISNAAQATRETEASSQQTLDTASELASLSDDLSLLVQRQG